MKKLVFLALTAAIGSSLCGCNQNSASQPTTQDVKAFQGGPPTAKQIQEMKERQAEVMKQSAKTTRPTAPPAQ